MNEEKHVVTWESLIDKLIIVFIIFGLGLGIYTIAWHLGKNHGIELELRNAIDALNNTRRDCKDKPINIELIIDQGQEILKVFCEKGQVFDHSTTFYGSIPN